MDPPLALAILAGGHACSREGQGTQQAGNQQNKDSRWHSDLRSLKVVSAWVMRATAQIQGSSYESLEIRQQPQLLMQAHTSWVLVPYGALSSHQSV